MTDLKKIATTDLKKQKREIDTKLFNLNRLQFDKTELVENKIKDDLNDLSMKLQTEIESRKRKPNEK